MNEPAAQTKRLPTFFVPHGAGPCFFMQWNPADAWDRTADFLRHLADDLPQRPAAIVVISGHWQEAEITVTSAEQPELIYDYHGFPAHTYALTYPAPGNRRLAERIIDLLGNAGIAANQDPERGYDHGVFIPLKVMFPDAAIPVVQVSLRRDLDAAVHIEMGKALAPLRDENVLIVGSGMSFHNVRGYGDPRFAPISDEFDEWLQQAVAAPARARDLALQQWDQAPAARLCHPPAGEEHLLPLMVAAGAAGNSEGRGVFSDRVMHTTLSAFKFG